MKRLKLRRYNDFFFDLDDTLWDFRGNSRESLFFLFESFQLKSQSGWSKERFVKQYREINDEYWSLYRLNLVERDEIRTGRFRKIVERMDLEHAIDFREMAESYLSDCPNRRMLIPGAISFLGQLKAVGNRIHIITNGFDDVQHHKISNSGLLKYVDVVVTSDSAKSKKPDPKIFQNAIENAGASLKESIMIGDSIQSDITGAKLFGIDHLHFNRNGHETVHASVPTFQSFAELSAYFETGS